MKLVSVSVPIVTTMSKAQKELFHGEKTMLTISVCNSINDDEIDNLMYVCNNDDVNSMYDSLKHIMFEACSKCGLTKNIKAKQKAGNQIANKNMHKKKEWFNDQCYLAKKDIRQLQEGIPRIRMMLT